MLLLFHYLEADVKGYSLPPADNSLFNSINGSELCHSVYADIKDRKRLASEMLDFQPDFVFHLAAQSLVLESYLKPAETFEVNVIGTVNVLEALRNFQKECNAVIVTTDKVYEQNIQRRQFIETDKLGGHDPYSSSKACCELVVQSFHKSFFNSDSRIRIASARSGNVIGGGDLSENRIVPDLIRAIKNNKPLLLRNPISVRPWQHVLDTLLGYLVLGAKLGDEISQTSLSWNFAPLLTEDITVKEVVERFFKILEKGTYEEVTPNKEWHEAPYLQLNAMLAHDKLGWSPKLNPWIAIDWTASWYKDVVFKQQDSRQITLNQIMMYFNL
jgi:CDP-glucose 4,6-dehydratase